jgi:hypothetical protein
MLKMNENIEVPPEIKWEVSSQGSRGSLKRAINEFMNFPDVVVTTTKDSTSNVVKIKDPIFAHGVTEKDDLDDALDFGFSQPDEDFGSNKPLVANLPIQKLTYLHRNHLYEYTAIFDPKKEPYKMISIKLDDVNYREYLPPDFKSSRPVIRLEQTIKTLKKDRCQRCVDNDNICPKDGRTRCITCDIFPDYIENNWNTISPHVDKSMKEFKELYKCSKIDEKNKKQKTRCPLHV